MPWLSTTRHTDSPWFSLTRLKKNFFSLALRNPVLLHRYWRFAASPVLEQWDIYFHLYIWNVNSYFYGSTRLLLNEIYLHLMRIGKNLPRKFQTILKTEAVVRRCSVKKMFLEISQNSQENTCVRVSFLIKLQAWGPLLKKRPWHRCFPVDFAKSLRTPFFTEHLWWLLL